MKLSESFFYTLREDVKDEESVSGNLLVKSGMFKITFETETGILISFSIIIPMPENPPTTTPLGS